MKPESRRKRHLGHREWTGEDNVFLFISSETGYRTGNEEGEKI
jgi:hypothetical protein